MDRYDVVALFGLLCLAIGCAMQFGAPVGLMVFGAGLVAGAVMGARSSTPLRSAQNDRHPGTLPKIEGGNRR